MEYNNASIWLWRFPREGEVVWARVIKSIYGMAANGVSSVFTWSLEVYLKDSFVF